MKEIKLSLLEYQLLQFSIKATERFMDMDGTDNLVLRDNGKSILKFTWGLPDDQKGE